MKKNIALLLSLTLGLTAVCAIPALPARAADTTGTETVTMYRLYNPNSGEHFYTGSETEKAGLVEKGWNDEGIGWIAPAASNTPVYRLYNPNSGDHHYTLQASERDLLIGVGWNYESIGWYSDDEKTVPVYREFNPNVAVGTHNYTTDKGEHDWLVSIGWENENIGWYAIGDGKNPIPKKPDDDSLEIGDIVVLGKYEQDNDLSNGPEPIEWQYIGDRDGHKYLLSKYVLDHKYYNDEKAEVTWETCTLREWLNNEFYNTAFTATDKQRIVMAHNENPDSYELFVDNGTGAEGGNDTDDKIFLLSWTEARDYLDGKLQKNIESKEEHAKYNYNQKLLCKPTAYAEALGVSVVNNLDSYTPPDMLGCCSWWLRSPGRVSSGAANINANGSVNNLPVCFPENWYGNAYNVRPALLID